MKQSIVHIALVVRDYDEALAFYIDKLNFVLPLKTPTNRIQDFGSAGSSLRRPDQREQRCC